MAGQKRSWRVLGAAATTMTMLAAAAAAQTPETDRNDAVYQYRGADRNERLIEKARREGALVLYTSPATSESVPLTKAFEKKYGVKVEMWRAIGEKVVQKTVTEAQGKRHAVDAIETNGPELAMLSREKPTSAFYSPHIADIPATSVPSRGQWIPDRLNFFAAAYNTTKVKRDELPKTDEGFLDARWTGRIGIEATDTEWTATVIKSMGERQGMNFFKSLSDMRPDVRKGHTTG
jgi:iron(III) transport system substrate-binding protein